MGVRLASSSSSTIVNASIPNGSALTVVKTGIFGLVYDNAQVFIQWWCNVITGAAATGIQTRVQKNVDITGVTLNNSFVALATASANIQLSGCWIDTPGVVGSAQYSIALQVSGGAAALTIQDCIIMAYVL